MRRDIRPQLEIEPDTAQQRPEMVLQRGLEFGHIVAARKPQGEFQGHRVVTDLNSGDRFHVPQGLFEVRIEV